jgi:hypothetical protein
MGNGVDRVGNLLDSEIARCAGLAVHQDLDFVVSNRKGAGALELERRRAGALVGDRSSFLADHLAVVRPPRSNRRRTRLFRQHRGENPVIRLEASRVRRDGVVAVQPASELQRADVQRRPARAESDRKDHKDRRRRWTSHSLNVA